MRELRFADLFCGLGGFRVTAEMVANERGIVPRFIFSCDIDRDARRVYATNFGVTPDGDITTVHPNGLDDFDVLMAGFPCQAFSVIGKQRGFRDERGALFFHVVQFLDAKRPRAFILENVKQLVTHDNGETLARILEALGELGYQVSYRVLNALDFGLPQKRERVFIVGFREGMARRGFYWSKVGAEGAPMKPLDQLLERGVDERYIASKEVRDKRRGARKGKFTNLSAPLIWHQNKSGNVSALPYSCALRSGASYNYLLVNGERRLTEREMLRLQGFPESYTLAGVSYTAARKLTGNSVAIPVVAAVLRSVFDALEMDRRVRIVRSLYKGNHADLLIFDEASQG